MTCIKCIKKSFSITKKLELLIKSKKGKEGREGIIGKYGRASKEGKEGSQGSEKESLIINAYKSN